MRWAIRTYRPAWRPWFAWFPVEIDGQRVWLETVERYREWHGAHDGVYPFDKYRFRAMHPQGEAPNE